MPEAESKVKLPASVSISPAAVMPRFNASAFNPAKVGLASVVKSWLITPLSSTVKVLEAPEKVKVPALPSPTVKFSFKVNVSS